MPDPHQRPTSWMTGRSSPPLWFRLVGCLGVIAAVVELFGKRGVVVGVMAAVVDGTITLSCLLAWERVLAWSKRHPLLDSSIIVPLLFLALACSTKLPTAICVLIALAAGLPLTVLGFLRRSARQRNGL